MRQGSLAVEPRTAVTATSVPVGDDRITAMKLDGRHEMLLTPNKEKNICNSESDKEIHKRLMSLVREYS